MEEAGRRTPTDPIPADNSEDERPSSSTSRRSTPRDDIPATSNTVSRMDGPLYSVLLFGFAVLDDRMLSQGFTDERL